MRTVSFKPAKYVGILRGQNIWILVQETDDGVETISTYWRTDDFGNAYQIRPLNIYPKEFIGGKAICFH